MKEIKSTTYIKVVTFEDGESTYKEYDVPDKLQRQEREIARLQAKVKDLKRHIHYSESDAHRKNIELDALHYVWSTSGKLSGVWSPVELTKELVETAEVSVRRMRAKFNNNYRRAEWLRMHKKWQELGLSPTWFATPLFDGKTPTQLIHEGLIEEVLEMMSIGEVSEDN